MAFKPVKKSSDAAQPPATKTKVTKADAMGVAFKTLRMCPFDAEELEKVGDDGNTYKTWPWQYLATLFKKTKDGKYGAFTVVTGTTMVDENDPDRSQDKYEIKQTDGNFQLMVTTGYRKKVFGEGKLRGKDGCVFEPNADVRMVCLLQPMLKRDGSPRAGWYEGDDEQGNSWQVIPFETKEDREARKARGGGGSSDGLADFA